MGRRRRVGRMVLLLFPFVHATSLGCLPMTIPIKSPCEKSAARATPSALQTSRGPWVLIVTILASSMAFIDGTVVNVALPALQTALHATVQDMQWVVEA